MSVTLRSILPTAGALALVVALAACVDTGPTAARPLTRRDAPDRPDKASICHQPDEGGAILSVGGPSVPAHLAHGDYVAGLVVDAASEEVGDGIHFARIGDAIATARAARLGHGERETAACRITIAVAAGTYAGRYGASSDPALERFPLVIDVPDVTLAGALTMQLDELGRATAGTGADDAASVITSIVPLTSIAQFSQPLVVVNGHPDGSRGDGAVISGFVFQSGRGPTDVVAGGLAIFSLRVTGLSIEGNRFERGFSESIDLRATSGAVDHNHLGGGGGTCDICFAGPGDYRAEGNRLLAGGIPGILIVPSTLIPVPAEVEQYVLPATSAVTALVRNNEVRNHLRKPVGTGVRVGAVGVGAPNVAGRSTVQVIGNRLVGNNFGIIAEAAFPVAGSTLRGDIDLALDGNEIVGSCQHAMLVSLSRHTTGLRLQNAPYLRNSTYTISLGGNLAWDDVWYAHPAGFGNTLVVDGAEIDNGARVAYDATRTCAPTS